MVTLAYCRPVNNSVIEEARPGNSFPPLLTNEYADFQHVEIDSDRQWSREEECALVTLRRQGKTFQEIASRLRRKEFAVACKYLDIVPLPSMDGRRPNPVTPEPVAKEELSVCVMWIGYHPSSLKRWIYRYTEFHYESESGF